MSRYFGWWNRETQEFQWNKPRIEAPKETIRIQTDEIEPTESYATDERRIFTSRRKLYDHYKEHGYEVTGGDHLGRKPPEPKRSDPKEIRDMAEKAYYDIKYDKIPIDERSRELCRQEERQYKEYLKRQRA